MNDNKGKVSVFGIVISIILVATAGVCGWFLGNQQMSSLKSEKVECEKNLENVRKEVSDSTSGDEVAGKDNSSSVDGSSTLAAARCYGTYFVNNDESQGKYILSEDGKYQVVDKEDFGVFVIHENTITFIRMKHTTGPRDQDPIYTDPKSYLISDDCSTITLLSGHVSATLNKQDN